MNVPLAPQGVFLTAQGEGLLCGEPMAFVRLAGCSVGCRHCDTDYRVARRVDALVLLDELLAVTAGKAVGWAWVTGGEPTDRDLSQVLRAVRAAGLRAALATAGTREVDLRDWDFVSVSPHAADNRWVQRAGSQINLVPGLGDLTLEAVAGMDLSGFPEGAKFVTPLADREGRATNARECLDFVSANPGFRLGWQAHKAWGVW